MYKYVMSDIHGCYDEFIKMLELINFSDKDELYILGDVIDRGYNSLDIIDYIVSHKNITFLKGNHEKMYEDYFESGDALIWFSNGGQNTFNELGRRDLYYRYTLYRIVKDLPIIKVVDKFILVHAGLLFPSGYEDMELDKLLEYQKEDINLWTRDYLNSDIQYEDYKIICGHTPVQTIRNRIGDSTIIHRPGHIFIDCGCVHKSHLGELGCLRLDDMKEFYIK